MEICSMQNFDRVKKNNILKGSTASIFGVIGTFILLLLILVIYIPPTLKYLQGSYYESQFKLTKIEQNSFYTGEDIRIAIQFKNKLTNEPANHTEINQYALAGFYSVLGTRVYAELISECADNYFSGTVNPVTFANSESCISLPVNYLFESSFVGDYGNLGLQISARNGFNPFEGKFKSELTENQRKYLELVEKNYYVVYFTSKERDQDGVGYHRVNKLYSTELGFLNSTSSTFYNVHLNVKNTQSDISVMPWYEEKNSTDLVWRGEFSGLNMGNDIHILRVVFSEVNYRIKAYRYYQKLDWLLGIIGGACFLFFIIFWIVFNYINKHLHVMRQAQKLCIQRNPENQQHQNDISRNSLETVKFNPFCMFMPSKITCFCSGVKKYYDAYDQSEREADIVKLIKKIKVSQRNCEKLKILDDSYKKVSIEDEGHQDNGNPDEVLGLTTNQIDFIKEKKDIYKNNTTAQALLQNSQGYNTNQNLQKKNQWDQAKGRGYKKSCLMDALKCFVKFFDIFGAKPNLLLTPHNSSCFGFLITILIVLMSILTVVMTIHNMNKQKIIINQEYLDTSEVKYNVQTGVDLKFALCMQNLNDFSGASQKVNLQFFYRNSSGTFDYSFRPLNGTSANIYYQIDSRKTFDLTNCLQFEQNIQMEISSSAYFGFRVSPYCSDTVATCATNINTTITTFHETLKQTNLKLYLPLAYYDPQTQKIVNSLEFQNVTRNLYHFANVLQTSQDIANQETIFMDQAVIIKDNKASFMRQGHQIQTRRMIKNQNTPFPISRSIQNVPEPYFEFQIKPSNNQIQYVIRKEKMDYLLGIIGGVFVFWYMVFHFIGKLYNSEIIKRELAKKLYSESDSTCQKHFCGILPSCCHCKCCIGEEEAKNQKNLNKRISEDLNYISILRHADICYRLSTSLFKSNEAKNLSLVYYPERISIGSRVIQRQGQMMEEENCQDQIFQQKENSIIDKNQVVNDYYQQENSNNPGQSIQYIEETSSRRDNDSSIKIKEQVGKYKFADQQKEGILSYIQFFFDLFKFKPSLTYQGKRQYTSCFGGFMCMIMFVLIVLVSYFTVGAYLYREDYVIGTTTSLQQQHNNIKLIVGQNFQFAITFSTNQLDIPQDVSFELNGTIGLALFLNKFVRNAGEVTNDQTQIDLVPCPQNYLHDNLHQNVDENYYSDMDLGYCIPDGTQLQVQGMPQDEIVKNFYISLHNKGDNATGASNLKNFMTDYHAKIHFTTPKRNPHTQKLQFEITSLYIDLFNGQDKGVHRNVTLSKQAIVYDNKIGFRSNPKTIESYYFNPYYFTLSESTIKAFSSSTVDDTLYYNVSFRNGHEMKTYYYGGRKFYEVFGLVGGIIAFFMFLFGCIARAFNQYAMHYNIGRDLYFFYDKSSFNNSKAADNANNLNEFEMLLSFICSIPGSMCLNNNHFQKLRLTTLIHKKVKKDLSLYNCLKKLHRIRQSIGKNLLNENTQVVNIYLKHILNNSKEDALVDDNDLLKNQIGPAFRLSQFDMQAINNACHQPSRDYDLDDLWNIFCVKDGSRYHPMSSQFRLLQMSKRSSVELKQEYIRQEDKKEQEIYLGQTKMEWRTPNQEYRENMNNEQLVQEKDKEFDQISLQND